MISARTKGRLAEHAAAAITTLGGYRVIARNFAIPGGEIDIIAQKRSTLAIIEVRLRGGSAFADGLESVDIAKQQRILRAAEHFIARHPSYTFHKIRFDVLSFGERDYAPHLIPTIRWTRNAFNSDALPELQNSF